MTGVDRQRGEDGEDLAVEGLGQVVAVVVVERGPVRHPHPGLGQGRHHRVDEDGRLPVHELGDALTDGPQGLAGAQAVGRPGAQARVDLILEPGHPHLEELVESLGEDGQELDPLEQRGALVVGEVEQPGPEFEPGQLPVREALGAAGHHGVLPRHGGRGRRRLAGRGPGRRDRGGAARRFGGLHRASRLPPVGSPPGPLRRGFRVSGTEEESGWGVHSPSEQDHAPGQGRPEGQTHPQAREQPGRTGPRGHSVDSQDVAGRVGRRHQAHGPEGRRHGHDEQVPSHPAGHPVIIAPRTPGVEENGGTAP